jgi:hypothetical protein
MKKTVKMIKTIKGAENGVVVKDYVIGGVYELDSSFADDLIRAKFAVNNIKNDGGQVDINFPKKGRVKKFAPKK